jgi:chromosome segregation ATPase
MSKLAPRGITEPQIREAIARLQEENDEPTTTKIRNLLGTGSFTTIGTALAKWRSEQEATTKSRIPAVPDSVKTLFQRVWLEAWQSASDAHQSERVGFRAERATWEQLKAEMMAEINRLESNCAEIAETLKHCESITQQQAERFNRTEKKLAAAESRIAALSAEISHLREERIRFVEQLSALSERAAAAEARITT